MDDMICLWREECFGECKYCEHCPKNEEEENKIEYYNDYNSYIRRFYEE